MKKLLIVLAALPAFFAPLPAAAQDEGMQEIIVTGSRASFGGGGVRPVQPASIPAVGFRRTADFAVRSASITGDTRDRARRISEINQMVENAIRLAPRYGIQLSFGSKIVEDLDLANYRDFTRANLVGAGRPDTSRINFLVKVPLNDNSDMEAIEKKMDDFVDAVTPVGRAEFLGKGSINLSVVAPDQYRNNIIAAIAKDSAEVSAKIGPEYAVKLSGMQERVDWARWGDKQVLLYIPYEMTILPKG